MTYKQLCKYFGASRPTDLARLLGYTSQNVNGWKLQNRIPYRAQLIIQGITGGALIAQRRRTAVANLKDAAA